MGKAVFGVEIPKNQFYFKLGLEKLASDFHFSTHLELRIR